MSLKKDDLVELVEKDDNGWWLVKKGNAEGWAPNNYLELVPPKPKPAAHHAPPPPPPPPPAPGGGGRAVPAAPPAPAASAGRIVPKSIGADPMAKPVSVFPGMAAANGSAAPWKKTAPTGTNGSSPATTRPSSSLAGKPPPPPVANKPKPAPPPKPGAPKPPAMGGKPPIPSAPRPPAAPAAPRPGGGAARPAAAPGGQLDLAAAVSIPLLSSCGVLIISVCSWPSAHSVSLRTIR